MRIVTHGKETQNPSHLLISLTNEERDCEGAENYNQVLRELDEPRTGALPENWKVS